MYNITKYTKEKAKELNVVVKPSTKKNKKIDVFKNNKLIASIGAIGYLDYPNYIEKKGIQFANERKKLYKQRHNNDRFKKGTNGFFADKLLW